MNYISICGICIVCAIISLTLKRYNPEISLLVSVTAGVIVAISLLNQIVPAISQVKNILSLANLNNTYSLILFKSLGICFLCQFASDSCEDAGEKALASKIQLAGKISVVLLSLPLIEEIATTAIKLIQG